jgi:hypothetical protein
MKNLRGERDEGERRTWSATQTGANGEPTAASGSDGAAAVWTDERSERSEPARREDGR